MSLKILFLCLSVSVMVCKLDSVGGSKCRRSKLDSRTDFAVGMHPFSCQADECKSLNSQSFSSSRQGCHPVHAALGF